MIYLDTSAFLKTVLAERESTALGAYLERLPGVMLVSSALLRVEARRGVLRNNPARLPRADLALTRVAQLEITDSVLDSASRLPDPLLRSPDAIPLATARAIRTELTALLTYDERLTDAARAHGLPVAAPA